MVVVVRVFPAGLEPATFRVWGGRDFLFFIFFFISANTA